MAIEDAFELAEDLGRTVSNTAAQGKSRRDVPVQRTLRYYQNQRVLRVSAIHGMAGMAAFMASTYKVCSIGDEAGLVLSTLFDRGGQSLAPLERCVYASSSMLSFRGAHESRRHEDEKNRIEHIESPVVQS